MKRNLLICLLALLCFFASANTVTVGENCSTYNTDYWLSNVIPIYTSSGYSSISQQIYTVNDLGGASPKRISAITFYVGGASNTTSASAYTRRLQVWMMETNSENFVMNTTSGDNQYMYAFQYKSNYEATPGEMVFAGSMNTPEVSSGGRASYTIYFDTPFEWSGAKNILLTIVDSTKESTIANLRHEIIKTTEPRYVHKYWSFRDQTGWTSDLYMKYGNQYGSSTATESNQISGHKYVCKITFTFEEPSKPSTPVGLTATATTSTSALLSWNVTTSATSYKLQQSATGEESSWSDLASPSSNSYAWTGLRSETTYYVRVAATNAQGDSEYSEAISFTTDAIHSHDGFAFDKWSSTTSLPASGNYYLSADVVPAGVSGISVSGTLNLCLNGHSITYTGAAKGISVASTGTLNIYDEVGGGLITSQHGTATIQVYSGGCLAVHAGSITNTGDGKPIVSSGSMSVDWADAVSAENLIVAAKDQTANVSLTRSLTSAQYNTFCLPFALTDAQLQSIFGVGYDLQELTGSSLDGETLNLEFTKCTDLEAGKPYLLQPSVDVTNRVFEGVTITATSPGTSSTTYVDYKAVYSPTELEGENKNLLFLGAGNELFWPESTGNLNGFRAYFEIKDASAQAAKRARISMGGKIATGNPSPALPKEEGVKILRDGKLYLMYKGQMYDVQGKRI